MITAGAARGCRGDVRPGMAMVDRMFVEMFVYKIVFIYRQLHFDNLYDILSHIKKGRSNIGAGLSLGWPGTNIQRRPYPSGLIAKCQAADSW